MPKIKQYICNKLCKITTSKCSYTICVDVLKRKCRKSFVILKRLWYNDENILFKMSELIGGGLF